MTKQPRFITLLFYVMFGVCPLLFFTDLTRNPYYTQIVLLNILTCLVWLLWLLQAWREGEWVWVRSPLDWILGGLVIISLASWINAFLTSRGLMKPIYSEGSRAFIFLIVNTVLIFTAAVRFQNRDRLRHLLWITYVVSLIASVYGVAQYFGTEWIWPHNLNPYGSRPVSTFGNPNFMSSYLVLVLPVAIADYCFKITRLPRAPLFAVILAMTCALLATLTRSSWLGALIAVMVFAVGMSQTPGVWEKIQKPVIILAVALVLVGYGWPKSSTAAYSETLMGRITEMKQALNGTYGAVTQRFLIWLSAWEMVEAHPVIGQGWGCFELFYPFYQGTQLDSKTFSGFRTHANNAHNEFLEYWSQIGTLGLGLVIFLWIVFFRLAHSITRRLPVPWNAMAWGFTGGVAGMLVDNLANVSVHFAVPAFLFWWWVGSLLILEPAACQPIRYELTPVWRRALIAVSALMLIGFMARSACLWAEEVNFFEGFKLSKAGVDLVSAQRFLEKAYAYHQLEVNNNYELANIYARLGQKERALEMYQRALDANAGYDEIYFNRATLYMNMGDLPNAIHNYRFVLEINPLSKEAYNALAGLYLKDIPHYGDDAVALYHRALSIFPTDKDMWNNLGYLETQRKHWEEAYQAYHKSVEADPEYDLARRNLHIAALTAKGHNDDPYLKIDAILSDLDRLMASRNWSVAQTRVKELLSIIPQSSRVHFDAGNIYFGLGRFADAATEYEQSIRLKPDSIPAWQNLAVTFDQLKRPQDAQNAWQRVLQLDPKNAAAKARLNS